MIMQNVTLSDYGAAAGITIQHQLGEKHNRTQVDGRNDSFVKSHQKSYVQPLIVDETKQYMDGLMPDEESEDEMQKEEKVFDMLQGKKPGKKTRGRVKIKMEFIQNKLRRYTTFSKRKTGIMKKAYELSTLTGTQVMLLVASETGHVYTFATRKLQPMITSESGKALIQTCLNSPDPSPVTVLPQATIQHAQIISPPIVHAPSPPTQVNLPAASEQRMSQTGYEEPDLQYPNEDDLKVVQSSSASSIHYVTQSTASYPMSTYISHATQNQSSKQLPVTYSVQPVGGITTIFSPGSNSSNAVQLQTQNTSQHQPQILSGQLQLHRIHPQNIILTGNSPSLQSNHIILNPSAGGGSSLVMSDNSQVVSSARHDQHTPSSQQQDVIHLVNPEMNTATPLQMVYSPSSGVIYAPQTSTFKRGVQDSNGDVVSLQHTPVIQTALQQDSSANRQPVEEGTIIVRHSQTDGK